MVNLNVFLGNHNYEKIFYENLYDIKHEIKKLSVNKFVKKTGRYEIMFD